MKTKSLFYKIYFSVIAVFLVLLIAGLFVLNSVLSVFEAAQPTRLVDTIVNEYLQKGDLSGAVEKYDIPISAYESKADLNNAFKKLIADEKLTVSTSGKKLEGYSEVYNIKADDQSLLTFYLKKSKKGGKYGIKGYYVGYAEIDKNICNKYEVRVPADVKLVINGVEVAKKDRIDNELPKILTDKIQDNSAVKLQTVKIENLISNKFELKAYSADGNEVKIDNNNGIYLIEQGIEQNEFDNVKSFALNASQCYAKFMQEDAGIGAVAGYFDTSTEFYNYIRKTERFVWDHANYRFDDVRVSEVYKYTENLYSCRIGFTQVLLRGNQDYKDYFDKYVYIEKKGNTLKVIDMQTPSTK